MFREMPEACLLFFAALVDLPAQHAQDNSSETRPCPEEAHGFGITQAWHHEASSGRGTRQRREREKVGVPDRLWCDLDSAVAY